ncbi:hypothetical protein CPB84DRAFT_279507 [Gymnopilus junonius]|uniref:Secreted protein n=1 Tax=Gymnopilus junonius TaxID=109634 RepID=A0A9P5TIS4_GYMJU|nr:hypothetical protein CPB84DRAFT_279507 [Gymnopilus junonius]
MTCVIPVSVLVLFLCQHANQIRQDTPSVCQDGLISARCLSLQRTFDDTSWTSRQIAAGSVRTNSLSNSIFTSICGPRQLPLTITESDLI